MKKQKCFQFNYLKSICLDGCLLCFSGNVSANFIGSYSDEIDFTIKMENKSVRDVFSYIEKNSEFIFIYQETKIDLNRKVSIDVYNQPVQKILHEVFAGTNDTYSVIGRQIIVKKQTQKNEAEVQILNQQKKTVTGLLTDADGNPVIGATVSIKGTTHGVTTDIDGKYILNSVSEGDVLEFRYIGYNTEEKIYKGEKTINIRMMEASVGLEDVVIIGYGQQKKESVVSSLNTISAQELQLPGRSLTNNIAGQIAGVLAVQRSGEPGKDNSSFWIRGISSFAGGTSPLVLVDGIPRNMNDITPDEIESFTVLKDAAATAVYGAEGANGVVLVTSKRGMAQKPTLDVRAEFSMVTPTRIPKQLGSYDYLSLYNEATWESLGNPTTWTKPYSDEVLDLYRTHADPDLYPDADYLSLMKDWTHNERVTLNLRGGSDRVKYFVSGAFYNEADIFDSKAIDKYDANINLSRYNIRSNVDIAVTKTTDLSVDMSGQYLESTYPGYTSDKIFKGMFYYAPHIMPLIFSDGTFSESYMYNGSSEQNPYNMLNESGYQKYWNAQLQSKLMLKQKLDFITKGLSLKLTGSFDAIYSATTERTKKPTTYRMDLDKEGKKEYILVNEGNPNLSDPKESGTSGQKQIYLEASLNYNRTFNDVHDVQGMVLYMQKDRVNQKGNGLPYKKQSMVARVSYGYDKRYMLEGSFGLTGSENFAKGHRYGIFPAVGGAWYISNEKFMKGTEDIINKLKLRVSYGLTGNDNVGGSRFPYRQTMGTGAAGYNLGFLVGSGGGGKNNPGNGIIEGLFAAPYLSWEIEEKKNVGFDLGLLRGRIDLSMDVFKNDRRDILMQRKTISAMTGFRQSPWQNFGKVTNKGFDGNFVFKQNLDKVLLTFRGNVTYAQNKVIEYDEVPTKYEYQMYTGNKLGTPYLYVADGLYTPDDFNIFQNSDGSNTYTLKEGLPKPTASVKPGDIKYKDLNGDNLIDSYDQTYNHGMYSVNPEWVYGFGVSGEWKGLYAGVFFQGVANASINLKGNSESFEPFSQGDLRSVRSEVLASHWSSSDPYNQDVIFPRLYPYHSDHNTMNSTWWYRSGNFLRLKNVEVGYEFDRKILSRHWIKRARLYVQGTNIAVWDDVKMWDPELGNASGEKYPINMNWLVGLELGF